MSHRKGNEGKKRNNNWNIKKDSNLSQEKGRIRAEDERHRRWREKHQAILRVYQSLKMFKEVDWCQFVTQNYLVSTI